MINSAIYINTYSHNKKFGTDTTMCYMIGLVGNHQVIDIQRSIKYYGGEPLNFWKMKASRIVTTNRYNERYGCPWFESMSILIGYISKLLIKRTE